MQVRRVRQDVVLEARPACLVAIEVLVLRRAVREVERVVVGELRCLCRAAPGWIESADEVAEIERVVLVDLLTGLLLLGDARIEEPLVSLTRRLPSQLPVDVHRSEERKPP